MEDKGYDRGREALVALRRIVRAIEFNARSLAREIGLTTAQLMLLQRIARAGGRITPTEMASGANLTKATVSALLDKLEDKDLIRRVRDTKDRRRVIVELREKGQEVLDTAPDSLQENFLNRFAALEGWEQASLLGALERTATILDAAEIDASPFLELGELGNRAGTGAAEIGIPAPPPRDGGKGKGK